MMFQVLVEAIPTKIPLSTTGTTTRFMFRGEVNISPAGSIRAVAGTASKMQAVGTSSENGLFILVLTFLEYLRIDVAGFGAAAPGDVTGNIDISTLLLA